MENVELAKSVGLPEGDLFHVLTGAVPGFVWVCDRSGRVVYANSFWSEFSGLTQSEWLGFGWLKAIHPEDIPVLEAGWNDAHAQEASSYRVRARCRDRNGAYRWQKIAMQRAPMSGGFWMGCGVDIDDMVVAKSKDDLQLGILEAVATAAPLDRILALLCEYGEFRLAGARCSILLIDENQGVFTGGVGPSLPPVFTEHVVGKSIGHGQGACGTAAYLGEDVIVSDIANHSHYEGIAQAVLPHGVRACWSRPILGSKGQRLATFGFYYDEIRAPTAEEMSRIDGITHIASMAIERGTMMAALRESEEHYRHTVELNPLIPWTSDPVGRIHTVSSKWTEMTGLSADTMLNKGWLSAMHPDDVERVLADWRETFKTVKPSDLQYRVRFKDGQYRWVRARAFPRFNEKGEVVNWYGTLEDVHQHRLNQDRLRRAAYEDELTRLNNRRCFEIDLAEALKVERPSGAVGLIVFDLDDFKQVNDRFGHAAGDAVLRLFAHHLRRLLQTGEKGARLGGDEFAVIIPHAEDEDVVLQRADAITSGIDRQLRKNIKARNCNASAGAAISIAGDTTEELLRKADLALYQAKLGHRGGARLYSPDIRRETERRSDEIELARKALHAGWLAPHYQPKVALTTGRMVGLEALIRVDHPDEGLLPPSRIMAALDHPRLGGKIGQRLISKVIADMGRLRAQSVELGHVAVNLAAENLCDEAFPTWLTRQMAKASIPAEMIKLEITERVLLDELAETAACALQKLRDRGIRVSLDDFGTGYASLTHLQRFPVDEIKIDRSFMQGLTLDSSNAAIVKAMINLGRNLGLEVVAEGVEAPTQVLLLRSWGCNIAQGFLYARPMPADGIAGFVDELSRGDVAPIAQPVANFA